MGIAVAILICLIPSHGDKHTSAVFVLSPFFGMFGLISGLVFWAIARPDKIA